MDSELKAYLDQHFGETNRRFDAQSEEMNRRFDEQKQEMDRRFGEVDRRFDEQKQEMDRRFDEQRQETDRRFDEQKQETDRQFAEQKQEMASLRDSVHQTRILVEHLDDKIDTVAEGVMSNTQVMHRLHEESRQDLREFRAPMEAAHRHLVSRVTAIEAAA